MPFDQWYDDETREAATARVLQRRATKPGDRHVLTVVAEEFGIPQQTLRAWVEEAAPETAAPARTARPAFSRVVTTHVERDEAPEPAAAPAPEEPEEAPADPAEEVAAAPADEPEEAPADPVEEVAHPVAPTHTPRTHTPRTPAPRTPQIAALEAQAAELRAGNAALKAALRVLTDR